MFPPKKPYVTGSYRLIQSSILTESSMFCLWMKLIHRWSKNDLFLAPIGPRWALWTTLSPDSMHILCTYTVVDKYFGHFAPTYPHPPCSTWNILHLSTPPRTTYPQIAPHAPKLCTIHQTYAHKQSYSHVYMWITLFMCISLVAAKPKAVDMLLISLTISYPQAIGDNYCG